MAQFFIDRPIFAWVIALFILVMGGVAITQLPIAQYPPVAPPSIVITAAYPGASAQTLEDSVHQRHRARDERLARPDLHGVGEPGQRHRPDHAELRDRHQRRPGAGRRAEPARPRDAAPAAGGDAAGRARRQGALQLPAVHDPVVRQPGLSTRSRWATTRRATCCRRSSACPASARRSCSAPNARCGSGSTRPSWSASTCRRPTSTRRSAAQNAQVVVGHHRRPAQHRRARRIVATVVVNGPAQHGRAVRQHRAARQSRRLDACG